MFNLFLTRPQTPWSEVNLRQMVIESGFEASTDDESFMQMNGNAFYFNDDSTVSTYFIRNELHSAVSWNFSRIHTHTTNGKMLMTQLENTKS